ncbi:MAG: hypothetical protein IIC02_08235 [Planctomycetes bacterium]|nr:hypothetical protein [Planctomycetota bacterium]
MDTLQRVTPRKAALVVAVAFAILPLAVRASDADKLLKSLEERRGRVKSLHTVTETAIRQKEVMCKTRFEYWELTAAKVRKTRRVERTETPRKGKDKPEITESVSVSDGQFLWSELGDTGGIMVIKSVATASDDFGGLRDVMRGGKARTRPGEELLGMKTVVIEVVGSGLGASFKATYWIGEKNGIILKSRVTNSDGSRIEMDTSVCEIDKKIPESTFAFTTPDGAKVIDTTTIGQKTGT